MSSAIVGSSSNLNNHVLNKLVTEMTDVLKVSATQAMNARINGGVYKLGSAEVTVGKRMAISYPSVASVVSERLAGMKDEQVRPMRVALGRDALLTASIRRLGVDMRAVLPVHEQFDAKARFGDIFNERNFNEASALKMVGDMNLQPEAASSTGLSLKSRLHDISVAYPHIVTPAVVGGIMAGSGTAVVNKGVHFRLHEFFCVDETEPEWIGSDDISTGGAAIDDKGVSTKIDEFHVGGGFDDGDKKTYNPHKIMHSFLNLDTQYPKTMMVTLGLAEKDAGGFASFLSKLYEAIRAHIQKILEALGDAAGAWIGAQIGGSLGTAIGGPLGSIIGSVAGAILGALVGCHQCTKRRHLPAAGLAADAGKRR